MSEIVSVLSNQTITSTSSSVIRVDLEQEVILFWNITGPITGSSPTLQFTIQEIDPSGDNSVLNGSSATSSIINSTGSGKLTLPLISSNKIQISWTVGGGSPSFAGVNLTVISKPGNIISVINNPGTVIKIDPSGTTTQPVSAVGNFTVTQATASNLNANVSGTVTSNIGTTGGLALDATITGGTAKTQIYDGSNVIGTASHPVKTDPTGTTIQPVSGTITANAGSGNFTVTQATASNLNATVNQSTPSNLRSQTSSESNTGSAVPTQASMVGGSDGTNLKALSVDTAGRSVVVGAAADGAAIAGNPVLIAGQDGTNVQTIKTDTTGRVEVAITGTASSQVEGKAGDGALPSGNPVYIAGFDGTNIQAILTDTSGRIIIAPAGTSSTVAGFSFGDIALSSITTAAVRRTTYTEQSSNAQRSVSSSSANDTNASGTGAHQVKITYYDSTGAGPSTETVNLNGTTAVATVSSTICFIEKIEVVAVGSGGSNAGTISLFVNNSGGGGTIGTIATGDNRTFWAHHYTPINKITYITSASVVINGGAGIYIIKAKTLNVSTAVEAQISDFIRESAQSSTSTRNYGTPIQVTGPARILMYVTTEANTALTYRAAFDFYDQAP